MNDPDYFHPESPPIQIDADKYNITRLLVLAICGVGMCGICAPFAFALSTLTLERMNADGVYSGTERILVNVARIVGLIASVVFAVVILLLILRLNMTRYNAYGPRLP